MEPLVSILIPCYNTGRWVGEAIQCALDQTYGNKEVMVADDGSTDGSLDVIRSFGSRVQCVTGPNRGLTRTRNLLFGLSSGAFVKCLDADDVMDSNTVALQVATALENEGGLVYGPWRAVNEGGVGAAPVTFQTEPVPAGADLLRMHLRTWFCPVHSYLWPRNVLERLGGWNNTCNADEDADLMMRAILVGVSFVYCPESWVDYVMRNGHAMSAHRTAQSLRSRARVTRRVVRALNAQGRLDEYRDDIAWRYDRHARQYWWSCRATAVWCAREARRISGKPPTVGSSLYRITRRLLGMVLAERLVRTKRKAVYALGRR